MKFKGLLIVTLLVLSVVLSQNVSASGEYIQNFESEIKLTKENTVAITEHITYDFGSNERRGIYREIPVRYFTEEEKGFETEFNLQSVERKETTQESYQVTEEENTVRIRIGNPDVYITGQHTYEIRYTLQPVALPGETEDIFRLDVIGNEWDVPIRQASARLMSQPDVTNIECYTGKFGENTQKCNTNTSSILATFTVMEGLDSGEGLTIEAAFPPDSFNQYPEVKPMERSGDNTSWAVLGLVGLFSAGVLALLGKLGWSYLMYRKRRADQTVVPQYKPPEGLKPAEVGLLSDNDSDATEFTATLIDVATRGYITIEQQKDRKLLFFTDTTYRVHKQKPFDALEDFERDILEPLFSSGDSVDMESVDSQKMNKAIKQMHETLVTRLEKKGYYREKDDSKGTKVIKLKGPKTAWIIGFIITGIIVFIYPVLLFGVMVVVLFYGVWRYTSLHSRVTRKGYSGWAEIEGFKEFLMFTQKERLDFHDAPERNPKQFNEYLPYAIALGVEKKWAKQFEDIDVISQQHWYRGTNMHNMSAAAAASSLSTGLKSYAESNFSSSSSTGSGSSFSGGGVGGGGGGSW